MTGPCLCGDLYCPSCGDPGAADLEAAAEWLMETLAKARLSPDEYRIVATAGLAAVRAARRYAEKVVSVRLADEDFAATVIELEAADRRYREDTE